MPVGFWLGFSAFMIASVKRQLRPGEERSWRWPLYADNGPLTHEWGASASDSIYVKGGLYAVAGLKRESGRFLGDPISKLMGTLSSDCLNVSFSRTSVNSLSSGPKNI